MIGAARRIIEGILCEHGSRLDDEGLMTVMSEAEPLTPNHLIIMKSKIIPHPLAAENAESCDLYASK